MNSSLANIKALTFDTGGTILDWHGGISRAFAAAGERRDLKADWHEVTNEYRRRSLKAIVGLVHPDFNFDDVHRRVLDEVIGYYQLDAFSAADRDAIWRTWHALDAWPGFPAALAQLRGKYIVASFTLLTTALVIDVSRKNGFGWDAIISCEMIGHYKTRPEAYQTAAKWLQLAPSEILMVACHNFDLNAARGCGYKSAFVRRPAEWGPAGPPDPAPNSAHDIIVDDFAQLAAALGA
ncbi:MAG: haloacid dehalogenase type II [Betaproteobacteria bacterium]